MFSRPVKSGWKPVPTSRRLDIRPRITARPEVGSVIRERIFKSVDLPAPFPPMIPTTSPVLISNDTSRSAHNTSESLSGSLGICLALLASPTVLPTSGDSSADASWKVFKRRRRRQLSHGARIMPVNAPTRLSGTSSFRPRR